MIPALQQHYTSILYSALGERIGLLLTCSDEHKARQLLYTARRIAGDDALSCLQIRMWPDGGLAIVRGAGETSPSALDEL